MHATHVVNQIQNHAWANWFDAVAVVFLLYSAWRMGRKHGMSGGKPQMMHGQQWVAIIFAGAFLYRPFGDMLAQSSPVSHLFCYIAIYP